VSVEAEILPPQTADQTRTALPWDKSSWKITSKPMPALWCCQISSLRRASLIDGIQYEQIPDTESDAFWEQERIFEALTNVDLLAAVKVKNSIYEWVPVDSKVEQSFSQGLDQRHLTFKLFVKLRRSFTVRTPVGEYPPDWAIVKQGDDMIYLIRETKGNRNCQKMRSSEAYKARCGHKHFAALGVSFDCRRRCTGEWHRLLRRENGPVERGLDRNRHQPRSTWSGGAVKAAVQRALYCRCGNEKILPRDSATCYTLKRQDEEYFGGLREAILERDGHCCPVCGASGRCKRSIVVHHRVPGKSLLST
jgi:5-methylcytosine-specific restriction endonuclease McrA